MRRALGWAVLGLFLAGCAADVRLRHPATGQAVTCDGGYCPGVACYPAHQRQMRCIDDFQRQGFERVP